MGASTIHEWHFQLLESLRGARTLDEAAGILQVWSERLGCKALVYGFVGLTDGAPDGPPLMAMTIPDELSDAYAAMGGAETDPVAERVAELSQVDIWNLHEFRDSPKGGPYRRHPFLEVALDLRYDMASLVPIRGPNGAGSVFAYSDGASQRERRQTAEAAVEQGLTAAAGIFHEVVRSRKLSRFGLELTDKELDALRYSAFGDSVSDLSERFKISERAVDKRLAGARRKLGAHTTANAVYRAMIFGLL